MIGRTLSHFKITAKLGEGGMGEVYRATDTKLGREVAIKILPTKFTEDEERLARFDREAKLLASFSHANIAAIHSVGHDHDTHFLVMELAEGETLAERTARGPVPVDEAVAVAIQIAAGLEAAHEKGIIHRDLKPANVKLTPRATVKILDFGLAKAVARPRVESETQLGDTDTVTQISEVGALLGTPGYMSPEQIRGSEADARSDIWAFGCLLYEALTGKAAFDGRTNSDRLAAVLERSPDSDLLPPGTPPALLRLLNRCLRKDPVRRLHAAADVRIELEDALREIEHGPAAEHGRAAGPSTSVERTFPLTAELCRRLDRETLDPRVIGDDAYYLDNERSSEVLVFYLPGMGLDHRIFEETLARSPFRGIASNFYGCEPDPEHRIVMAMPDQLTVLEHLLSDAVERLAPEIVILTGFSLGADAAFRLLVETELDPKLVDGVLSLGCNLGLETCFFSARIAKVASLEPQEILPALREIGSSVNKLEEWVELHRYLAEVTWKYRSEMGVLRSLSAGTIEPFTNAERQPFAEWYRYATEHEIAVRCIFNDSEQEALRKLRLAQLDDGILGPHFRDDDFFTEWGKNHFQLIDPGLIERHLDWLLQRIRSP
ncbi:MAG: serine/threonine protein kinase [bacterium]|nr:serine/threonine protein kinase [bacterium]